MQCKYVHQKLVMLRYWDSLVVSDQVESASCSASPSPNVGVTVPLCLLRISDDTDSPIPFTPRV